MSELADRPLRVKDEFILLHWWRLIRWFSDLRLVPRRHEDKARIVTRALRRYFYEGLTRPGKILFVCSLLIFLFSFRIGSDLLLLTAAVGTALLTWSVILGLIYRPNVTLQRQTPATAVAGQPLLSQITITNAGRFPLFNFAVREMAIPYGRWPKEWSRPHQVALNPAQSTTIPVSFEPQKRGSMTLSGIAVQTYFPFFLIRFTQRLRESAEVYVLPPALTVAVPSLRHVAEQASKRLKFGTDNSKKGPSLEYAYSRQYQTGDSLRRLDHRASSRLSKPMSKIFEGAEEIRRDQVYLMVDLTLKSFQRWQRRPENESPLDERLSLAVEIGLSAQNEGFSLSGLATGKEWHKLDSIIDFYQHVATSKPERAIDHEETSVPSTPIDEEGLHIMVVGSWSREKQALLERWQKSGILTLVFLIPESVDDVGTLPVGSQFIEIQSEELKKQAGEKKFLRKTPKENSHNEAIGVSR